MSDTAKKICPNCGMPIEDFRRSGLLGCAKCYTTFRMECLSAARRVQKSIFHTGNRPTQDENRQLFIEQAQLVERYSQAIREGKMKEADELHHRLEEIARLIHPKEGVT